MDVLNNGTSTTDELTKIGKSFCEVIQSPFAYKSVEIMAENNMLWSIVPEMRFLLRDHNSKYHQETHRLWQKSIFTHVLKVFEHACKRSSDKSDEYKLIIRLSALFHDIAKPQCCIKKQDGNCSYTMHDIEGSKQVVNIFNRLEIPSNITNIVSDVVRKHMNIHDIINIKGSEKARRLLKRRNIDYIIELGICDTLGTVNDHSPEPDLQNFTDAICRWNCKLKEMDNFIAKHIIGNKL